MGIFKKAGESATKALIPGLNFAIWSKIIGKSLPSTLWLLFPIVNIFTFSGMCVDLVRSFGKNSFWESFKSVVLTPLSFFQIANDSKSTYQGPILEAERKYKKDIETAEKANDSYELKKLKANNPFQKSSGREWGESIIFAVFAAAFIRMFLIEAYTIPTSSMEGSLLVGDYLFVSKAHYGIRMPMTILQVPLLHNRLPRDLGESYLTNPSLPYYRLPAIENIDRNDPIVFNYPEGDSIYMFPGRIYSTHDMRRGHLPQELLASMAATQPIIRPIDKRDHYIKRCVAIPGDSLQVIDKQLYVNGKKAVNPSHLQLRYKINGDVNTEKLEEWGVSLYDSAPEYGIYHLTAEQVEKVKSLGLSVEPVNAQNPSPFYVYPHDPVHFNWTVDNFGPIYIPKKGTTVQISPNNIALYSQIIERYEGNKLEVKDNQCYINGAPATSYTFKQDYYWAMGDNRHNSEDSRYWGYVPEDHIVGKPLFIWFSTKNANIMNGIRWDRIFSGATKM
ncbi:MAG: signal peptidase I [Saprospiraceae bacterium]|nr:signal peptidase I [Saprospiraceae bacterium]